MDVDIVCAGFTVELKRSPQLHGDHLHPLYTVASLLVPTIAKDVVRKMALL